MIDFKIILDVQLVVRAGLFDGVVIQNLGLDLYHVLHEGLSLDLSGCALIWR